MKLTVSRVVVISSYLLTCISDYRTAIVIYAHARIYNKLHPLSGSFRCSVVWSTERVEFSPLAAVSGARETRTSSQDQRRGGSRVQVMATDPAVVFQVSNLG